MRDVLFVAAVVAFFVLALGYVAACGAIVGRAQAVELLGDDELSEGDPLDTLRAADRVSG